MFELLQQFLSTELQVLKLCAPFWLYMFGMFSVTGNAISFFAAQMGETYLAGISLGSMLITSSILPMLIGFASVFDVYGPQLCGKNQENQLGKLMIKCLAQGTVLFVVLLIPSSTLKYLMKLWPVKEDSRVEIDEIQEIATTFMQAFVGIMFLEYVIEIIMKFLANHRYMHVVYIMGIGQTVSLLVASYIIVIVWGFKTEGLVLAVLCSRAISLVGIGAVMIYKRVQWKLNGELFTREFFNNWCTMTKVGLASGLNLFFCYSGYMVAAFLSQSCGKTTTEAFAILVRMAHMSFASTAALTYTTGIQVGNALGKGDKEKIKYFLRLGIFNGIAERILCCIILLSLRNWYISLFTSDPAVIEEAAGASYLMAFVLTLEMVSEILARGILIVFEKDTFVSIVSAFSAFGVGMPVMITMVYVSDWKTPGLLLGLMAQQIACITCLSVRVALLDYSKEISQCDKRLAKEFGVTTLDQRQNTHPC